MTPAKPKTRGHSRRAVRRTPGAAGNLPAQDQPAPADRIRDERLQQDMTAHAAETAAARHRDGLTAIESDADAVPEDEQALDRAAAAEADERQARTRQPGEDA
jgi:hypothetical protein